MKADNYFDAQSFIKGVMNAELMLDPIVGQFFNWPATDDLPFRT
jgi:hypothetical protein